MYAAFDREDVYSKRKDRQEKEWEASNFSSETWAEHVTNSAKVLRIS